MLYNKVDSTRYVEIFKDMNVKVVDSPPFDSATKIGKVSPIGAGMIQRIKKEVDLPIVASGGITIDNAKKTIEAGADCISAIASISNKSNLNYEISKFQMLF
jgi:thiamine-phosphate pyrophosphorylase